MCQVTQRHCLNGENNDSEKQDFKTNRSPSTDCWLHPCMVYGQHLSDLLVVFHEHDPLWPKEGSFLSCGALLSLCLDLIVV